MSTNLRSVVESTFFEGLWRQKRQMAIQKRYLPQHGTSWQFDTARRLLTFSHLGTFSIAMIGTSAYTDFIFFGPQHPMCEVGALPIPTTPTEAPLLRLRELYPDVPEFQGAAQMVVHDQETCHMIASAAVVAMDGLFYYRMPNSQNPAVATWVVVLNQVDVNKLSEPLPPRLAALAPAAPGTPKYADIVAAFETSRPAASAVRLNWFRREFLNFLIIQSDLSPRPRAVLDGFVSRSGYRIAESATEDGLTVVTVNADDGQSLQVKFGTTGRMAGLQMLLGVTSYVDDGFDDSV
ncbi:hypothetical protein BJ742DRAFT_843007 [Cladochytrium replicatum]|nr:hypothetical protein BJ742DRAFT_843007 [Cladochytrium replicatum]